jgi:hypothetical protein
LLHLLKKKKVKTIFFSSEFSLKPGLLSLLYVSPTSHTHPNHKSLSPATSIRTLLSSQTLKDLSGVGFITVFPHSRG